MKLSFKQYSEYKNRVKMYEAFVTEFERCELIEDAINEELDTEQKEKVDKTVSKIPNRDEKIKKFWSKQKLDGSYDENFKNGRMTVPVEFDGKSKPHPDVDNFIRQKGYTIKDYRAGTAFRKETVGDPSRGVPNREVEREYKIGKVLQKEGAHPDIIKTYTNDPARASSGNSKYDLVITHHPHDVAGKSTKRGWSSCMNLSNGRYKDKIDDDLKQMTHEAYLVRSGEDVDKDPIARMSLKLHRSLNSTHSVLMPEDKIYGTAPEGFKEKVKDIVSKISPLKDNNIYQKHPVLYDDDSEPIKHNIKGEISSKVLDSLFNSNKIYPHHQDDYLNFVKPEHKYKNPKLQAFQKFKLDGEDPEKFKGDFVDVYNRHMDNYNKIKENDLYPSLKHSKGIVEKVVEKYDINNKTHRSIFNDIVEPRGFAGAVRSAVVSKINKTKSVKNIEALHHFIKDSEIHESGNSVIDKKNWEGSGDPAREYINTYHPDIEHNKLNVNANLFYERLPKIIRATRGEGKSPNDDYKRWGDLSNLFTADDAKVQGLDAIRCQYMKSKSLADLESQNVMFKIRHLQKHTDNNYAVVHSIARNHESRYIPEIFGFDAPYKYSRENYPKEHKLLDDLDKNGA
jgi:hypothetical protein